MLFTDMLALPRSDPSERVHTPATRMPDEFAKWMPAFALRATAWHQFSCGKLVEVAGVEPACP